MSDASNEVVAKAAHEKALAAIGNPSTAPLDVDGALASLKVAIDVHAEMVRTLIRRVEPVSAQGIRVKMGSISIGPSEPGTLRFVITKAPIASAILCQHEIVEDLTKELQQAIRELQV